jgi:TPR repeat protein
MREEPVKAAASTSRFRPMIYALIGFLAGVATALLVSAGLRETEPVQPAPAESPFPLRKVVDSKDIISRDEFIRRARAGDAKKQLALAGDYFDGEMQIKDDTEALRWAKMSADAGHVPAYARLGFFYDNMNGSLRDPVLAFQNYLKAAKHGDQGSQYIVAGRLMSGVGVSRDDIAAYAWYNVCSSNYHREAANLRDVIASRLSASQLDQAQKLSRELLQEIASNEAKR